MVSVTSDHVKILDKHYLYLFVLNRIGPLKLTNQITMFIDEEGEK
jgi:hypothetical protein